MTDPTSHNAPQTPSRVWLWRIIKWGLCAAVLVFVGIRAAALWGRDELSDLSVSPTWLLASAVMYLLGWVPSAWYWQRLMATFGNDVSMQDTARAYFCGHLGKYVPGKAGVLLIRAGMLKSRGHSPAIAALTATAETLLLMGTGLALGLALFPALNWPPVVAEYLSPTLVPLVVLGLVVLALPVIAILLRRLAYLMTPRDLNREEFAGRLDVKMIAVGLAVFCLSWTLHGISLGCTIRAVSPDGVDWSDWPIWTGTAALAASIGFIAIFAPAGIGVREGLLIEILRSQPGFAAKQAVVVAVLLRLVWLVAEIATAAGLYWMGRKSYLAPGEYTGGQRGETD